MYRKLFPQMCHERRLVYTEIVFVVHCKGAFVHSTHTACIL